jgi:hypothetical protein
MEIIGRNPTPDPYSIKDIKVAWEQYEKYIGLFLVVSLEPSYYQRNRYGNSGTEKKKNPCTLRIPLHEFHEMQDVLRRDLKDCYQFIGERDLLAEFFAQKHKPQEESKKAG